MSDYEILNQLTHSTEVVYSWMSLLASIVFAYIAAAYFFLHKAPWFTRMMTFVFFLFSVIFITGNLVGMYFHILAIIDQIDLRAAHPDAAGLLVATSEGSTKLTTAAGFWSFIVVMIGVIAMTFWMTFIWKPETEAA